MRVKCNPDRVILTQTELEKMSQCFALTLAIGRHCDPDDSKMIEACGSVADNLTYLIVSLSPLQKESDEIPREEPLFDAPGIDGDNCWVDGKLYKSDAEARAAISAGSESIDLKPRLPLIRNRKTIL